MASGPFFSMAACTDLRMSSVCSMLMFQAAWGGDGSFVGWGRGGTWGGGGQGGSP